jgi:vitamin K-dependent gamma-carboxylase
VYFYAGIAKLNPDWLSGNTVRVMMNVKPSLRLFYAYGGLLFDLLIVPFLMWRRTRVVAFVAAVIFHITNVINFGLATFPWFSIMMTALYFGTSWPRKFTWFDHYFPDSTRKVTQHKWLPPVLVAYCLLQLFLPLRQHLYPGETSWTEDGHMFSWRMKLRTKTGDVIFYVVDKDTKKTQIVFPQKYLTKKQMKDMVGKPDSILQFAHYLKQVAGKKNVAVHASARVSLNGMPKREMLDVRRDLSQEERELGSYDWVLKQKGPEFPRALSYQD